MKMKNTVRVDDPDILDMDPVQKRWMYENWIADQKDTVEIAKNHAYLVGSFWNPEAVKELTNGNGHMSTDEEFEESLRMVQEASSTPPEEQSTVRRRRRKIQG